MSQHNSIDPQRVIPESELILRSNGRVYHLNLRPGELAETILVVGDPDRVPMVSAYFDKVEFQQASRELVTHTGTLGGKRLSVVSSGMGTDNVELLMTELDALFNVDFETRKVKEELTRLKIIRIGTSGCLQRDIPLNAHLASQYAIGLDTLMTFYPWKNSSSGQSVATEVQRAIGLPFTPYVAQASERLIGQFEGIVVKGFTITAPGFYAPQGRKIRLETAKSDFLDQLMAMQTNLGPFTNFEMETAAYYAMAHMLGHDMLSLNALIANRATQQFSQTPDKAVDGLIRMVLERLT